MNKENNRSAAGLVAGTLGCDSSEGKYRRQHCTILAALPSSLFLFPTKHCAVSSSLQGLLSDYFRRSAVVERIRLREEWSALKGIDNVQPNANIRKKQNSVWKKRRDNLKTVEDNEECRGIGSKVGMANPRFARALAATNEVLRGVVALVEVGAESRALALRAALTALGATVVPAWSPLVTHLIWSHAGCRNTRAKARALACRLVSPLWVEACAASGERLLESTFPTAARASDLPSPKTLRRLLKKAEMENIPLADLLSDSKEEEEDDVKPRLRISSETEHDTTADTTTDTSPNTSDDKTRDQTDIETRVNTAPRRALPVSTLSPHPAKSRRKLFTQKEDDLSKSSDNETDADRTPIRPKRKHPTQQERRDLQRAERMARKLVCRDAHAHAHAADTVTYRVVLTGMSRSERLAAYNAIRTLGGRVWKQVDRKTTHVLLGSCREDSPDKITAHSKTSENNNEINNMAAVTDKMAPNAKMAPMTGAMAPNANMASMTGEMAPNANMTSMTGEMAPNANMTSMTGEMAPNANMASMTGATAPNANMAPRMQKVRTVNALLGAARGCRVLYAKWAADCSAAKRWLHHYGYEVPHLRKMSQKARVERAALGRMRCEYAYDVFNGMRVRVAPNAEQRDGVVQLLRLCGACLQCDGNVQNEGATQHGRQLQDGGVSQHGRLQNAWVTRNGGSCAGGGMSADWDIVVGAADGQVASKWVFDSVAAARMRTARRYVNKSVPEHSRNDTSRQFE